MGDRVIQSVSFSYTDPFERDLHQFALKQGVFSKYVKRLIQRDKEGVSFSVQPQPIFQEPMKKRDPKSFI